MKIRAESELMKNHKHATVMTPGGQFQVFQTPDGDSLLFSIGTDGVLYLTREVRGDLTGWNMVSLTEPLKKDHGKDIKAKSFEVSQSPVDGTIQIALVVNVDKAEWLYVSLDNSNSDLSWARNVPWQQIPFDAEGSAVVIEHTYIRQSKEGPYVVADVLSKDAITFYAVNRYHIDLEKKSGKYWNKPRPIPNLESNYTSLMGRRSTDEGYGTYTFGFSDKKPQLDFAPLSDQSEPEKLQLPGAPFAPSFATAIATAPNSDGTSQLFVAAGDALYRYAADQQTALAEPTQIMQSKFLSGVTSLYGVGDGKTTAIWALNNKNEVLYTSCPTGREHHADAWSAPLPILTKVTAISSFLNKQEGNHVLFAPTSDSLFQLSQDPVTTHWHHRQIMLPATSPDDLVEIDSFTTHIEITDDYNLPPAAMPTLSLSSSSPVSIYVDNVYHVLSHKTPLQITPDATGVVTIVQETSSLGAVCYHLEVDSTAVDINPMSNVSGTLSQVKSSDDLDNMKGSDDGTPLKNILPAGIDKNAAVAALGQLSKVKVPADGSVTPKPASSHNASSNGGNKVEHIAGDVFRHIKHAAETVDHYAVEVVDDVSHFVVHIGDEVYKVALTCAAHVAHAFEFVFQKIAVAFQDLIKYVGFLFNWGDILRTHKAIKNVFLRYAEHCVANLASSKQTLQDMFDGLEDKIKSWGDIEDDGTTTGSVTAKAQRPKGHQSPQSNWGMHQLKSNAGNGNATGDLPPLDDTSDQPLQDLGKMIEGEEQIIADMINNIKINVIDQIHTLTGAEIVKRIIANVLDVLLETAENVLVALVDIFEAVLKGVIDVLDQPVTIPVISPMYKKITHDELSMLDLVCLVAAIPVTVVYKIAYDQPPFPDDSYTAGVIAAPDFATLQKLCSNPSDDQAPTDQNTDSDKSAAPGSAGTSTLQFSQAEETTNKSQSGKKRVSKEDLWQDVTGILGAAGSAIVIVAALVKKERKTLGLRLNFAGYFPYIAPNLIPALTKKEAMANLEPKQPWLWNDALSILGIAKAGLDTTLSNYDPTAAAANPINAAGPPAPRKGWVQNWGFFSPLVEALLNLVWCVPPIFIYRESVKMKEPPQTQQQKREAEEQKIEAIITLFGDMGFNLSGILAITDFAPLNKFLPPQIVAGAQGFAVFCNGVYGLSCLFATPMVARHY